MKKHRRSLWANPDFLKLWVGETISFFGTQISSVAVPLTAVLILQASPFAMGVLMALEYGPFLFASLFAGVLTDRIRRRPILITANVGRALLLSTIPLATLAGVLSFPLLCVVVAAVGVLTVFFDVAYQSYLPALVEPDQLVEGNSKVEVTGSVAMVAGPAAAGVLVQAITAPLTVAVDAVSFLFSALCLAFVRTREPASARRDNRQNVWQEIGLGLRLVLDNPILRSIAACTSTSNFFIAMRLAVVSIFVIRNLGISPGVFGLVLGIGSAGALIGALFANTIARRYGVGPTMISSMLIGGIGALAIAFAGGPPAWALAMLTIGHLVSSAANTVYNINQISLRQSITPQHLLGRMNATMRFFVWGIIPLGSLMGGALGELFGVRAAVTIATVGGALAFLWVYFSPVRTLRPSWSTGAETIGVVSEPAQETT